MGQIEQSPQPFEEVFYYKNDAEYLIKSVLDENNKATFIFYKKRTNQTFYTNDSDLFNSVLEIYHPDVFNQLNRGICLKNNSLKNAPFVLSVKKNATGKICRSYILTRKPNVKIGRVPASRIGTAIPVIIAIGGIKNRLKNC